MTALKRRQPWIITLLLSGAALGYVFFVFLPQMRIVDAVHRQVSEKHELIAQKSKLTPLVSRMADEIATIDDYLAHLEKRITRTDELPRLFGQISQLVSATGAFTTRFEPQPAVNFKQVRKVPIALSVKGSFEAVERIIAGLEMLPAAIWIEDLRIDEGRENRGDVTSELLLGLFIDNREISD